MRSKNPPRTRTVLVVILLLTTTVLLAEQWPRLTPEEWTDMTTDSLQELIDSGVPVHTSGEMGPNALMMAAAYSNGGVVKTLLEEGARVDAQDMGARAAIHYAAGNPDPTVMSALLSAGAHPYEAVLASAARTNTSQAVIRLLIEAGIPVNSPSYYSDTPLRLAAANNPNPEIVRTLLDAGSQGADQAFLDAVTHNTGDVVRIFLETEVGLSNTQNDQGATPFVLVAEHNPNQEVIPLLIENGMRLDRSGPEGSIILYASIRNENPEVMRQLLEMGLSFSNDHREQALDEAITWNASIQVVEMILEMGVDVDRPTEQPDHRRGYTALMHLLRRKNHIDHVRLLLEYGADVNVQSARGTTPLMVASYNVENPAIIEMLLDYGADITVTDSSGRTARWYIQDNEHLLYTDVFWRVVDAPGLRETDR